MVAAALTAILILPDRPGRSSAGPKAAFSAAPTLPGGMWRDRFGDGWPDAARLDRPEDRDNFRRWITYLAESTYYQSSPLAHAEVSDCSALIRFAYRNALMAHTPAWRQSLQLRAVPGFGSVGKYTYPEWSLGRGLFRTEAGPFLPDDLRRQVFQEFADAQTLLRYNAFPVSRDLRAARVISCSSASPNKPNPFMRCCLLESPIFSLKAMTGSCITRGASTVVPVRFVTSGQACSPAIRKRVGGRPKATRASSVFIDSMFCVKGR